MTDRQPKAIDIRSDKFFDSDCESYISSIVASFNCQKLSGTSDAVCAYGEALSQWFGVKYALPVASGSAAIYLALHALNIKQGDYVVVSALAPVPSLLPILQYGAIPLFVDVVYGTFEFDLRSLEESLKFNPKAIMAVPLWGYPMVSPSFISLANVYGIPIIEDSAHAHGTLERDVASGTVGAIGCFSTHENKLLSTGEGGFMLTNDEGLYNRAKDYSRLGYCEGEIMGFNFKLSSLQALLGSDRLVRLKDQIIIRRKNAMVLSEFIGCQEKVSEIGYDKISSPNYYSYGMLIKSSSDNAKKFIDFCHQSGVPTNAIKYDIKPSYNYGLFARYATACINAEMMAGRMTSLPTQPGLSSTQLEHVAEIVKYGISKYL